MKMKRTAAYNAFSMRAIAMIAATCDTSADEWQSEMNP